MFADRRILIVVPARGGSKGVKRKNIHPLLRKPLIVHTAELVAQLPFVDRAVVSTDDPRIAEAVGGTCLSTPFVRPAELSGDRIGDAEVLAHALEEMERQDGCVYDIVVMLQPTCPLREPHHVTESVQKVVEGDWDAVWTVSATDLKYHPLKQLCIGEDGGMRLFDPAGHKIVARQQLRPTYTRNGACYAMTRTCLLEQRTTLGRRSSAVVVNELMISIDTLDDFIRVEEVMRRKD